MLAAALGQGPKSRLQPGFKLHVKACHPRPSSGIGPNNSYKGKRTNPGGGVRAETAYDPTGAPTHLTYTKTVAEDCTWLDVGVEDSINGQIVAETGNLASHQYSYDKAGRLPEARETPSGGLCTTRLYANDEDSNRKEMTTRSPRIGGACANSGGTTQSYKYDAADP